MYEIGDEEIEALKKLFEKKRLFRYQPNTESECELFEKEFSWHLGTKYSLLVNSGTNALLSAVVSGGIQPGDEVLIPAYTFVATAAAVAQAGAVPIVVNVDQDLSLDFLEASQKLSPKTKALILVHMDGLAANVSEAKEFCRKHSLVLIEDVAQAMGGSFEDKKLGSFGHFGCFSLNENKLISCGEGGILVTNDRKSYESAFCLHDTPFQFSPTKQGFFTEIRPFLGQSMRVSEIQGTIMRVQLGRLEPLLKELRLRKNIFTKYLNGSTNFRWIKGFCEKGDCGISLHLQFPDAQVAAVAGKRLRDNNLSFYPLTLRPAHASWKWAHLFIEKFGPEKFPPGDHLPSLEILSRTLKMDIDLGLSQEKTLSKAEQIGNLLQSHEINP